jgi:hypothetical protein
MIIDIERLKADRDADVFAVPPVEIRETLAFAAGIMRDGCLANPEISDQPVASGVCRIIVETPTPRLRRLLAILDWLPLNASSEGYWCVDEPVPFPCDANGLAVDLTARHYAEAMNLLFAPGDGLFTGGVMPIEGGSGIPEQTGSYLKDLAERIHVADGIATRVRPPSILHRRLGQHLERLNLARTRGGFPPLPCPSFPEVQGWSRTFFMGHADWTA